MKNNALELKFLAPHHFLYTQDNFYSENQYESICISILLNDDVIATALVIVHEVKWCLTNPLNYMPLFPSPFFTFAFFPKCPPNVELTVLIAFCKYFLEHYPKYKAIYTKYFSKETKQLLLEHGFKYYARDIIYYKQ